MFADVAADDDPAGDASVRVFDARFHKELEPLSKMRIFRMPHNPRQNERVASFS
jgi:hypothetical protein